MPTEPARDPVTAERPPGPEFPGDGDGARGPEAEEERTDEESDPGFAELLEYLNRARGFDFGAYKPSSLTRRIRKRMGMLAGEHGEAVRTFADYTDYLEVHPDEFSHLFNTILINVTGFFRDPAAWDVIRGMAIPRILGAKGEDEPIRVWSAGCASGEEAYTLAMLLVEALGPEAFRSRVKIYATDASEGALLKARQGCYSAREVEGVPAERLARHFRQTGSSYVFDPDLRRCVVFGRHDLAQHSPISRVDLLACRNTLMYFNAETQSRVLSRFSFALNPHGLLFLGKSEMLLSNGDVFTPVDLKHRVFEKSGSDPGVGFASLLRAPGQAGPDRGGAGAALRDAALQDSSLAIVVVDTLGRVAAVNEAARSLFAMVQADVGRMLRELPVSYRPLELVARVERALTERHASTVRDVEWIAPAPAPAGEGFSPGAAERRRWFDAAVVPLLDARGTLLGASVVFTDVTDNRRLREDLQQANQERETAQEELQTTNEELQSTVEELETTNEELQSTNEELETTNEELQSTNEELRTSNDELRLRSEDLESVSGFWQTVVSSVPMGMVIVDRDLRVQVWNPRCESLWGLRAEEVAGEHFPNLDFGLAAETLRAPLRAALAGSAPPPSVLEATNRRGRSIGCRVWCVPLARAGRRIEGAILLMEELDAEERSP